MIKNTRNKIKPSQLKFKLGPFTGTEEYKPWAPLMRYITRVIVSKLLNNHDCCWQFFNYDNRLDVGCGFVMTRTEEIAHWLLRVAGYDCSPHDIMKLTGFEIEESVTTQG